MHRLRIMGVPIRLDLMVDMVIRLSLIVAAGMATLIHQGLMVVVGTVVMLVVAVGVS